MKVTTREFGGGINILKFDHKVTMPFSIDFSKITEKADNLLKVIKAGTPMTQNGVVATVTDGKSNAIGILLHDVYEDNPNTALIIHGFIDKQKAEKNVGKSYDAETIEALTMVSFL